MAQCGACTVHVDGTRCARASRRCRRSARARSRRSRACRPTARTRCSARGPRPTSCSAATASPGQIMTAVALLAAEARAHRRGHRRRAVRQHLPLRHVPARARRDPPRRELKEVPSERSLVAAVAWDGRRRPRRRPRRRVSRSRAVRVAGKRGRTAAAAAERVPADRHRRLGHRPARALRDGPGHLDRPRDADRRGARVRLVEGQSSTRRPRRSTRIRRSACR